MIKYAPFPLVARNTNHCKVWREQHSRATRPQSRPQLHRSQPCCAAGQGLRNSRTTHNHQHSTRLCRRTHVVTKTPSQKKHAKALLDGPATAKTHLEMIPIPADHFPLPINPSSASIMTSHSSVVALATCMKREITIGTSRLLRGTKLPTIGEVDNLKKHTYNQPNSIVSFAGSNAT
jgi:hypothetical protein